MKEKYPDIYKAIQNTPISDKDFTIHSQGMVLTTHNEYNDADDSPILAPPNVLSLDPHTWTAIPRNKRCGALRFNPYPDEPKSEMLYDMAHGFEGILDILKTRKGAGLPTPELLMAKTDPEYQDSFGRLLENKLGFHQMFNNWYPSYIGAIEVVEQKLENLKNEPLFERLKQRVKREDALTARRRYG